MTPRTASRLRLTCLLVLLSAIPIAGQTTRMDGGSVSVGREFGFYWETHLHPAAPALDSFYTSARLDGGVIYRVMLDRERRLYFGYGAAVAPASEAGRYRVTVMPLALTPGLARSILGDDYAAWTALQGPSTGSVHWDSVASRAPELGAIGPRSVTTEIGAGEVLSLTLLTNPATGQQIVDYVSVQNPQPFRGFEVVAPREFSFAAGAPRDFGIEDAELRISAPRLSIDGRLQESTLNLTGSAAGTIVWIYVPGRGRFFLSLAPHAELGFSRAGEVRGSALTFTAGGETFALVSGGRIAGSAPFNLYVRHEPEWVPTYQHADRSAFIMDSGAPGH